MVLCTTNYQCSRLTADRLPPPPPPPSSSPKVTMCGWQNLKIQLLTTPPPTHTHTPPALLCLLAPEAVKSALFCYKAGHQRWLFWSDGVEFSLSLSLALSLSLSLSLFGGVGSRVDLTRLFSLWKHPKRQSDQFDDVTGSTATRLCWNSKTDPVEVPLNTARQKCVKSSENVKSWRSVRKTPASQASTDWSDASWNLAHCSLPKTLLSQPLTSLKMGQSLAVGVLCPISYYYRQTFTWRSALNISLPLSSIHLTYNTYCLRTS